MQRQTVFCSVLWSMEGAEGRVEEIPTWCWTIEVHRTRTMKQKAEEWKWSAERLAAMDALHWMLRLLSQRERSESTQKVLRLGLLSLTLWNTCMQGLQCRWHKAQSEVKRLVQGYFQTRRFREGSVLSAADARAKEPPVVANEADQRDGDMHACKKGWPSRVGLPLKRWTQATRCSI